RLFLTVTCLIVAVHSTEPIELIRLIFDGNYSEGYEKIARIIHSAFPNFVKEEEIEALAADLTNLIELPYEEKIQVLREERSEFPQIHSKVHQLNQIVDNGVMALKQPDSFALLRELNVPIERRSTMQSSPITVRTSDNGSTEKWKDMNTMIDSTKGSVYACKKALELRLLVSDESRREIDEQFHFVVSLCEQIEEILKFMINLLLTSEHSSKTEF
ncbi:hypothetical protein PFISCL1PPCAC_19039, partial [Pristionchus fissidentatus]